jgi:pimeloyl-ACP methyl ester carboxylesterase
MVAVAMALDYPADVSSLVLVGGYFYPSMRIDALLTAPVALPLVGDAMRYTVTGLSARAMLKPLVKKMFDPMPVPPAFYVAVEREMMLRPIQLRANAEDGAFMVPVARSLCRRYHELRLPVTLIAGGADKVVDPEAQSGRLHAELAQSRFIAVPGAGHMAHYKAQDQLIAAIENPAQEVVRERRDASVIEARPVSSRVAEAASLSPTHAL